MEQNSHSFRRGVERVPPDQSVRLAWLDERRQIQCTPAKCIDATSKRLHVEVRKQIPLHTSVMLRVDGMSLAGAASVRYVTRCGDTFILVLDVGG